MPDHGGGHGLELRVAVGVTLVGRSRREPHADEADDVGGAVEERVEAVGLHRRGVADDAVEELCQRHGEVQRQHDPEDRADLPAAVRGWGQGGHGRWWAADAGAEGGYGRGTSPTRSRTLASVRSAMASARSAPVLRTSSV